MINDKCCYLTVSWLRSAFCSLACIQCSVNMDPNLSFAGFILSDYFFKGQSYSLFIDINIMLKGTATLMISMFYQKQLYEP